jgi:hypothetical protein
LVERLDQADLSFNRRSNWFTRLPPETQQELLQFRDAYLSGRWADRTSDRVLFTTVLKDLQLAVKFSAFAAWVKQR